MAKTSGEEQEGKTPRRLTPGRRFLVELLKGDIRQEKRSLLSIATTTIFTLLSLFVGSMVVLVLYGGIAPRELLVAVLGVGLAAMYALFFVVVFALVGYLWVHFMGPRFNAMAKLLERKDPAQLSLFGMFSFLISLIVYVAILPILNATITEALPNIGTLGQFILLSVPVLLLLGLLMSLLYYIRPQYPPPY